MQKIVQAFKRQKQGFYFTITLISTPVYTNGHKDFWNYVNKLAITQSSDPP